jgi:hypothetical protein
MTIFPDADADAGLRDWVTDSCTLPTVDQPLRVAEFDALFADSVRAVDRVTDTTVRLILDAGADDRARELAARESGCCTFFEFAFTAAEDGTVAMRVTVPVTQSAVLDALAARAAAVAGLSGR